MFNPQMRPAAARRRRSELPTAGTSSTTSPTPWSVSCSANGRPSGRLPRPGRNRPSPRRLRSCIRASAGSRGQKRGGRAPRKRAGGGWTGGVRPMPRRWRCTPKAPTSPTSLAPWGSRGPRCIATCAPARRSPSGRRDAGASASWSPGNPTSWNDGRRAATPPRGFGGKSRRRALPTRSPASNGSSPNSGAKGRRASPVPVRPLAAPAAPHRGASPPSSCNVQSADHRRAWPTWSASAERSR
jgi:hypothetical protein